MITTEIPRVISADEYERIYKPADYRLVIIGPTSTWRQEWSEWEAIRDIVQNALDETEHYSCGYDDEGLYIADNGRGIAVADFLLGPQKTKPPYARGRYGEGMKIAALTLLRSGYKVRVETVGKTVWLVFYQQEVNGKAESLAALWKPNGTTKGTIFHIIGYFGPDYKDRFVVNLRPYVIHMGPSNLAEPRPRYNELISYPPGRLYARDIYMRDIKSKWSYNLWGFNLAPDRHAPEEEAQVYTDISRLWATVFDEELLAEFLKCVKHPPEHDTIENNVIMISWDMGRDFTGKAYVDHIVDNAKHWQAAWRKVFGDNVVLRTNSRWDAAVKHLGYVSVSLVHTVAETLSKVIPTDDNLISESQHRLSEVMVIPDDKLSEQQHTHLRLARAIASLLNFGYPVKGVFAAAIPPASDRVRTAGMYQMSTSTIYIDTGQLEWAHNTVDTIIHELAHHVSREEDGHPAHNQALTQVASWVVKIVSEGLVDDIIEDARW